MPSFLKQIFGFIKEYPGILYSFLLLICIPLILFYNTYFITRVFQENIDSTIKNKAFLAEEILRTFLIEQLDDPNLLQEKIELVSQKSSEIKGLRILREKGRGNFLIAASYNPNEIGYEVSDAAFALAYSQEQSIAHIIQEGEERIWNVVQPIYDKDQKVGLISLGFSLKDSDLLLEKSIFRSYIIAIIGALLSLTLIFQHIRLLGYVSLTQRLKEIDKMKDDFIKMATHELQSPIINIRGHLNALKEELGNLDQEKEGLFFRADISAKNLAELISDILEVSRIEQGRLDFASQPINPANLIIEVIDDLEPKTKDKNLVIEKSFQAKKTSLINANPNRFKQIINNILYNAIKYTPKGKIFIKTEEDAARKRLIIYIQDTGIGIPAQAQARMFERFYRVRSGATADIPGTGLGLWIAKQLTEKMGGKIYLESIEGVGTRFTLVFPMMR